ncbi:hypothetical protein [Actinomycetospora chiangmaiensis]|uniref:hypothetical protein n=1 Tax=Actinomycetospora chiangmaiensis TaxID=402650 RepID=UPI000381F3DE|nr:hypothetical protein [Actinomycetospora chiangmaiensis]
MSAATVAVPAPRTVLTPRPVVTPGRPPEPVTRTTAVPAPTRRSSPGDVRATSAGRSSSDDIAARATTTLIPNSPGDRAKAGPVFVDGSGRRARRVKGLAAAVATVAAGYVGVVVTGALAGSTGPVAVGPTPVASGASLAPAPAVPAPVVPSPIVATPADATTTKAPVKKPATSAKKAVPRTTAPRTVAPVPVAPAPVAPARPAQPAPSGAGVEKPVPPKQPEQQQKPVTLQNA